VADGLAALTACRTAIEAEQPFDLVVLDLTIPGGIGGVETLARIREIQPAIRAIATSGYSSDAVMAEPGRFGFQATLAKPYLVADVHRVVSSLLPQEAAGPAVSPEK
jgi:two-component system cell cycle sensor histidine kinase/response regulator CckA